MGQCAGGNPIHGTLLVWAHDSRWLFELQADWRGGVPEHVRSSVSTVTREASPPTALILVFWPPALLASRPSRTRRSRLLFAQVFDKQFAEQWFAHLGPTLQAIKRDDGAQPVAFNDNIRIYRYVKNQSFGPHIDNPVRSGSWESEFTLLLYLTGGEGDVQKPPLRGGETRCGPPPARTPHLRTCPGAPRVVRTPCVRAVLRQEFFLLRTALKDCAKGQPIANH